MDKKNVLTYLRNCLADGNRMDINPSRLRDAIMIENHNLEDGNIPKTETQKAFSLFQKLLSEEKENDEVISGMIGVTPVVVSPFYIVPSVEHGEKYKSRNPMPVYPLWIPGLLDREGSLSPPDDAKPWLIRSVLEPLHRAQVTVILSSVETVDEFLTKNEVPQKVWNEYWEYCRLFFKTVTGKNWNEIKEHNYVSANKAKIVIDTHKSFFTSSILNTYDYLRDEENLPKLFEKYISIPSPQIKPLLTDSKMESLSKKHVGYMGDAFSLSDTQRQILMHLFTIDAGDILAVTGPPGTGKTTLIQNVVANLFVESAIRGKEPSIIVASSNNNQAIKNILDTFSRAESKSGGLGQRWLPKIESYGLYLSNKVHGSPLFPQCTSITGEGFPKFIETREYFNEAKNEFLKNCGLFAKKNFQTPKLAIDWIHDQLIKQKKIINDVVEAWKRLKKIDIKVKELGGLVELEKLKFQSESKKKSIIDNKKNIKRIRENLLDAEKNESFFSKIFFFFKSVKDKRIAKNKMIFSDYPYPTEGINWEDLKDLYNCIEESIIKIGQQEKEAKKRIYYYTSINEEYRHAYRNWKSFKKNHGFKQDFPDLNGEIDISIRHKAFLLATHYWEGRWLLECQKMLEKHMALQTFKKHNYKWHRYSMLTPCFVSTFYTLPKFFSYPIHNVTGDGYSLIPNLNFIDLLIIDEAGQVSPEIGAPSFALAKKALVLGDINQIEPIWRIPSSVDIGNLGKSGIVKNINDPDQIKQRMNEGLSASRGNLMKVAQKKSHFKLEDFRERGLFLSEHRRCDPEIISYCNELAYKGMLIPLKKALKNRIFQPFGYAHVHGICSKKGGSRVNHTEAESIAQWLKKNKEKIENHYQKVINDTVGIITPFSAQAETIKKLLIEYGFDANSITVGTVHALQGAEREIIIFSCCYDYRDRGQRLFFDRGINMLNVAVSRSKDSFIVFGEMSLFDPTLSTPSGLLAHYLFKSRDNLIMDVTPPLRSKTTHNTRISTLEDHQKVLAESIEQARDSVVIVSPFISIHAIKNDHLIPKIKNAVERRVNVTVYTDRFLDKSDSSLKQSSVQGRRSLTDAGAKLKILNGIHNKTLCRDNDLLVEGSFNWLSAIRNTKNRYQRYEASICYQGEEVKSLIDDVLNEMEKLEINDHSLSFK